jgi:hypothetical protein
MNLAEVCTVQLIDTELKLFYSIASRLDVLITCEYRSKSR